MPRRRGSSVTKWCEARKGAVPHRSDDGRGRPARYRGVVEFESLLVLLAVRGAPLEGDALDSLADARATWVRLEREGEAVCLAARVRHDDRPEEFRTRVRGWAAARGWAVTVAPCAPSL